MRHPAGADLHDAGAVGAAVRHSVGHGRHQPRVGPAVTAEISDTDDAAHAWFWSSRGAALFRQVDEPGAPTRRWDRQDSTGTDGIHTGKCPTTVRMKGRGDGLIDSYHMDYGRVLRSWRIRRRPARLSVIFISQTDRHPDLHRSVRGAAPDPPRRAGGRTCGAATGRRSPARVRRRGGAAARRRASEMTDRDGTRRGAA